MGDVRGRPPMPTHAEVLLPLGKRAWEDVESCLGVCTFSLGLVNKGAIRHSRRELQVSKVGLHQMISDEKPNSPEFGSPSFYAP